MVSKNGSIHTLKFRIKDGEQSLKMKPAKLEGVEPWSLRILDFETDLSQPEPIKIDLIHLRNHPLAHRSNLLTVFRLCLSKMNKCQLTVSDRRVIKNKIIAKRLQNNNNKRLEKKNTPRLPVTPDFARANTKDQ